MAARRAPITEPVVHMRSYIVDLTGEQVGPEDTGVPPHFSKFTKELMIALQMMFMCGAKTPLLDARSAGADTPIAPARTVFWCEP